MSNFSVFNVTVPNVIVFNVTVSNVTVFNLSVLNLSVFKCRVKAQRGRHRNPKLEMRMRHKCNMVRHR